MRARLKAGETGPIEPLRGDFFDHARRISAWIGSVETLTAMHLYLTFFWAVMIIPTVLWWRSSVPWIGFMSVWALLATHWSGYQGGRSERLSKQHVVPKLEPIAEIVPKLEPIAKITEIIPKIAENAARIDALNAPQQDDDGEGR